MESLSFVDTISSLKSRLSNLQGINFRLVEARRLCLNDLSGVGFIFHRVRGSGDMCYTYWFNAIDQVRYDQLITIRDRIIDHYKTDPDFAGVKYKCVVGELMAGREIGALRGYRDGLKHVQLRVYFVDPMYC